MPILERKLAAVQQRYGKSEFERRHYALFGLMCIYGIELLADNAIECRDNLAGTFARVLTLEHASRSLSERSEPKRDPLLAAAEAVLASNIVQGDALAMTDAVGAPIVFPEWAYLGRGRYQRRDFRYDALTQRSAASGTLFDAFEEHEIFTPVRTYPVMTIEEIAA